MSSPDVGAETGYTKALKARLTLAANSELYPPGLDALYAGRGYASLWVEGGRINARGGTSLIQVVIRGAGPRSD